MSNGQSYTALITATTRGTIIKYSTVAEKLITPAGIEVINEVPDSNNVLNRDGFTNYLPYNSFDVFNSFDKQAKGINDGIIEIDDKKPVTNTNTFPYTAIGQLMFKTKEGDSAWGTETLVGPNTLLTVEHNIYQYRDKDNKTSLGYFKNFIFYAGRKDENLPAVGATATEVWIDKKFIDSASSKHDWGIIKLDKRIEESVGWLGWLSNISAYNGLKVAIYGYPSDKPDGTIWTATNYIVEGTPNILINAVDTTDSQSRSAMYVRVVNHIIGILRETEFLLNYNIGLRITKSLFNVISRLR